MFEEISVLSRLFKDLVYICELIICLLI